MKHTEAIKHAKGRNQAKFTSFFTSKPEGVNCSTASHSKSIGPFTISDATLEAEIYWLAKLAYSNYCLHSSDYIGDLFQAMFLIAKLLKTSH